MKNNKQRFLALALATSLGMAGIAYGRHYSGPLGTRLIVINRDPLTPGQLTALEDIERVRNIRIPDGAYWYDKESGLAGAWNGPAQLVLPPYLDLGGKMPSNCSAGGTGVYVNGRELHPAELAMLWDVSPKPGARYSLDPHGNLTEERNAPSRRQRFAHRVELAIKLQAQQAEAQRAQNAAAALQTNQNGGRAKYAMDGISVGQGYYLDRSGSSATRY